MILDQIFLISSHDTAYLDSDYCRVLALFIPNAKNDTDRKGPLPDLEIICLKSMANYHTLGRNKPEDTAELIRNFIPFATVDMYLEGITEEIFVVFP